jgi:hypothetical protein
MGWLSSPIASLTEGVMKTVSPKRRCHWCREFFKAKTGGRPALYCSASCRQRAYEKRKWSPPTVEQALAWDLLPTAARRQLLQSERHAFMIELLMNGTVPLATLAQIDGVLDQAKPQERASLLRRIEGACKRREDDKALSVIARWRLSKQQPA